MDGPAEGLLFAMEEIAGQLDKGASVALSALAEEMPRTDCMLWSAFPTRLNGHAKGLRVLIALTVQTGLWECAHPPVRVRMQWIIG